MKAAVKSERTSVSCSLSHSPYTDSAEKGSAHREDNGLIVSVYTSERLIVSYVYNPAVRSSVVLCTCIKLLEEAEDMEITGICWRGQG